MIAAAFFNTFSTALHGEPNLLQQGTGAENPSVCSFASLVDDLEGAAVTSVSPGELADAGPVGCELPVADETTPQANPAALLAALPGTSAPVVRPAYSDTPQRDEFTPCTLAITRMPPVTAASAVLPFASEIPPARAGVGKALETAGRIPALRAEPQSGQAHESVSTQEPKLMQQARPEDPALPAAALERRHDAQALPKGLVSPPPAQAAEVTQVTLLATAGEGTVGPPDVPAFASQPVPAGAAPVVRLASGFSMQHDLEQTIERLITARIAGRTGDVRLAVDHSAFGPVAIRLDRADTGLSAVLSSADPDFAPAVQAALTERVQIERMATERVIGAAETIRAEPPSRTSESIHNGRNLADPGGSGTQQHPASENGSEARKRMHPRTESTEETLVTTATQRRTANGLFA